MLPGREQQMINNTTCTYNNLLKHASGNVCVAFTDKNDTPQVVQKNNYYPWLHSLLSKYGRQAFGLRMAEKYDDPSLYSRNRYLYNGKELVPDVNLNWYDYGARMYDPQLGRFTCLDPIADQFRHVTPYNYAENKVINCIDLWGLQAVQVSAGARGALPLFGPWGISGSYEFGLILDKNYDLVLYCTVSLGGSVGGALSVGINATFYPTANSYKDLVGLGVDVGVSTPFFLSGQGNVSFSDNGPKGGGTLSYGFHTLTAGAAAYADVTFTNLLSDPINISKVTVSTINQASQMMGISKQQVKIILLLMKAKIEEEEEKKWAKTSIMIPEVVVVGKKTKTLEQRIEDMIWQFVRPNAYGNTGRYNKPGRSCDQYYSDDFLKWYYGDSNNQDKK